MKNSSSQSTDFGEEFLYLAEVLVKKVQSNTNELDSYARLKYFGAMHLSQLLTGFMLQICCCSAAIKKTRKSLSASGCA